MTLGCVDSKDSLLGAPTSDQHFEMRLPTFGILQLMEAVIHALGDAGKVSTGQMVKLSKQTTHDAGNVGTAAPGADL
jgi:hypothetical protein